MTTADLYQLFLRFPIVSTDSRKCPTGSMFFALKGENFNGNKFALQALQNGASVAIVDEPACAIDERFVLVTDVLTALQDLARFHRSKLTIPVLGITGSNGKTTTKELCASVLNQKYKLHFTQGNLNNHIGVPLTILGIDTSVEFAIIEMGANHPGNIKELAEIALPDYAIITNVGKAHLEGFGSFEGVIKTEKELYDYIKLHHGKIFIDADNPYLKDMSVGIDQRVNYGKSPENTYIYGYLTAISPFVSFRWYDSQNNYVDVDTSLIGEYNLSNLLAAIAVGTYFGVSPLQCKNGIESYVPENNRSQYKKTLHNELILDAYNANPTSMEAALRNFSLIKTEKQKMLIVGDMFELGDEAINEHQKIADLMQELGFQKVFLVGKNFSSIQSPYQSFETGDLFVDFIQHQQVNNCYILIKGSRSMQMERAVDYL